MGNPFAAIANRFARDYFSFTPCKAVYIPDVADEMDQTSNLPKIKRDLKKIGKTIKSLRSSHQQKQTVLKKSHNKAKLVIRTYRKKINTILDKLEKQSEEDVNRFQQTTNNKLQKHIKLLDDIEKELEQIQETVDKAGRNTSQVFTRVKRCQEWIDNVDRALLDLNATQPIEKIEYNLNKKIENLVADVVSFGTISTPETLYTAKKMKEYSITVDKDLNKCNITSICMVGRSKFVAADNDNNRLKLIDVNFKVLDSCELRSWPWCVCSLSEEQVLVSQGGNRLQFVGVDRELTLGDAFRMDHSCLGLAYCDGKLYVTDQNNSVFTYKVEYERIQCTSKARLGEDVVSQARNLAIAPGGSLLYVADCSKGLVTITTDGKNQTTLKPREIKAAFGVCVAPNGYVFVVGQESENVIQVDRTGERKLKELVPQSKGLTSPQAVCIDITTYRLVVAGACNKLRVFDLVQEN